ncbi:MAG: TRAP transporter small permease [Hyphomicrobiales bacterium]
MSLDFAVAIRRLNRGIALVAGVVLAACVLVIIADIVLRKFGVSLGGSDEISGYVMAVTTAWGMSFALSEFAHIRIDAIQSRLPATGRTIFDCLSGIALAATAVTIAFQCWPVLAKTIHAGSRANTPLSTPLWIPQSIWFSGWVWFAVSSCLLAMANLLWLARRGFKPGDNLASACRGVDSK